MVLYYGFDLNKKNLQIQKILNFASWYLGYQPRFRGSATIVVLSTEWVGLPDGFWCCLALPPCLWVRFDGSTFWKHFNGILDGWWLWLVGWYDGSSLNQQQQQQPASQLALPIATAQQLFGQFLLKIGSSQQEVDIIGAQENGWSESNRW